ncbi:hypothetical protein [Paraburkholderia sp. BL6665CI2N2]|uniref:hypothetical protein n=1 Tax=Paraburkholderia sp. BL6665CI2N2 TaxID=1938806 RepID=UPI0014170E9F|nr:hypothetical protein [Paraburkholderia sp. BL6665CI2N2]
MASQLAANAVFAPQLRARTNAATQCGRARWIAEVGDCGPAPAKRGIIRPKDERATISCGIDLTDYAALCFANSINHAYEIATESSVKIAFKSSLFGNMSCSALSGGRYNLKHFVTALVD